MKERTYYILLPVIAALAIVGWVWGPKLIETIRHRYDQLSGNNRGTVDDVLYFMAISEPIWEPDTTQIVPALPDGNGVRLILLAADQDGELHYLLITFPDANIPDYARTHIFLIEPTEINNQGQAGFENPQEFMGHLLRWRNDLQCWVELPYFAQPNADGITCQLP